MLARDDDIILRVRINWEAQEDGNLASHQKIARLWKGKESITVSHVMKGGCGLANAKDENGKLGEMGTTGTAHNELSVSSLTCWAKCDSYCIAA
jgi:hypothetical protein